MTPAIFGCQGPAPTAWETGFFREVRPIGFILFRRNCESSDQLRALCDGLRELVDHAEAPILIDQEGGRVVRLLPPEWRAGPPAAPFGALYERDPGAARDAVRLNALLLADELRALGVNVDCVPVLDVPVAGAHDIVGDRAFSRDPKIVAELGRLMAEAMLEGGVQPVIKHIPGHGRAIVDSHLALPRVETARPTLSASDFLPFKACKDMPWGMTAHILYTDIDPDRPATQSESVVGGVIRGEIGFDGVLMTDDLSMAALTGDYTDRTRAALAAGCDVALHCNGQPRQMEAVAAGAGGLSAATEARLARARAAASRAPAAIDRAATEARVAELLAGA